jgi:hypothetical protein
MLWAVLVWHPVLPLAMQLDKALTLISSRTQAGCTRHPALVYPDSPCMLLFTAGAGDAAAKDGTTTPATPAAAPEAAGKRPRPRPFRVEPLDSNASAAATAALLALARISPGVRRQVEAELLFQEVGVFVCYLVPFGFVDALGISIRLMMRVCLVVMDLGGCWVLMRQVRS